MWTKKKKQDTDDVVHLSSFSQMVVSDDFKNVLNYYFYQNGSNFPVAWSLPICKMVANRYLLDDLLFFPALRATYPSSEYNAPPFSLIGKDDHFCLLIGHKNLEKDVEIWPPVMFRLIAFSGFRGEVEYV